MDDPLVQGRDHRLNEYLEGRLQNCPDTPATLAIGGISGATGATTRINRKDFGLSFNAILDGRLVVSEEVQIMIKGELVEQPQAAEEANA